MREDEVGGKVMEKGTKVRGGNERRDDEGR